MPSGKFSLLVATTSFCSNLEKILSRFACRGIILLRLVRLLAESPGSVSCQSALRGAIVRASTKLKDLSEVLLCQQAPPKRAEAVSLALFREAQKTNSLLEKLVRLQRVAVSGCVSFVEISF